MGTFKLTLKNEYEIEAESEEEAFNELEERFAIENTTAENEFWGSLEVEDIEALKERFKPIEHTDFTDDYEKMEDFKVLTKKEFLDSYSYLTEEEYDLTLKKVVDMKLICDKCGFEFLDNRDLNKFEHTCINDEVV